MVKSKFDVDMLFSDTTLSKVITLPEVCLMWGLSERQVSWAIWKDYISARKSFTGGGWLINYYSACDHFGTPNRDISEWMVAHE